MNSLCSGGFADATADMCWFGVLGTRHRCVTDGMCTTGFDNSTRLCLSPSTRHWSVEVYVSQDTHQGVTVVFGYMEVSCELYVPNIYRFIHT